MYIYKPSQIMCRFCRYERSSEEIQIRETLSEHYLLYTPSGPNLIFGYFVDNSSNFLKPLITGELR